MNDQQRAVMQMALETLCNVVKPKQGNYYSLTEVPIDCAYKYQQAITALREALAQPQDHSEQDLNMVQGEWVDLTDDELLEIAEIDGADDWFFKVMVSVIAKFKEKNAPPVVPQGEPVAWIIHMEDGGDTLDWDLDGWLNLKGTPLYTTPPSVEAAIEATKEKAAKVCELVDTDAFGKKRPTPENCAAAIRSMK